MRAGPVTALAAACLVAGAPDRAGAGTPEVLGTRPTRVHGAPGPAAGDPPMTGLIWAPGIDDGYVPQGVAWGNGAVYLSSYRSAAPEIDRGPCRIFKIDPRSGAPLGHFDLPETCGHLGGLAYVGKDTLVASDTRRIYRIDTARAFAPNSGAGAVTATVALRGTVKGSFADFDGRTLFVGAFEKSASKARGYFLPLTVFDTHDGKAIDARSAIRSIPLPRRAQGAAFDREGRLWISASSSRFGQLYRLADRTGRIASSHEMPIGMQDIAFDDEGRLWSVSEAGSLRWQGWARTFPVIFRIDPGKLGGRR